MAIGNRLLILTEAGEGIGLGHYSRCLAIRQFMISEEMSTDIKLDVRGEGLVFEGVEELQWVSTIDNLNSTGAYSHVLVDSYLAPLSVFYRLKEHFRKVIALDDFHRVDSEPDLIINPNIYGDRITYRAPSVGGRDFIILRKSFREERRKIDVRPEAQRVLVTLGGSDIHALVPKIVNEALSFSDQLIVYVVAGSEAYAQDLRKILKDVSTRVHITGFAGEEVMKGKMLACDFAISACGQTLHELSWLGVPVIGICTGEDQLMNMREYMNLGIIDREIIWSNPQRGQLITESISTLRSFANRKKRSEIAFSVVHNRGLNLIRDAVFS